MTTKNNMIVNYYGDKDNYIHLKFGHARKCYHFTKDFTKLHKDFVKKYEDYWSDEETEDVDNAFLNAQDVVYGAEEEGLPPEFFYFNYTDEPAKSYEEIYNWIEENK